MLADQGETLALACVFVALVGSFLVSYTRAKAEALGLKGDVGLMARPERIVLLARGAAVRRPRRVLPYAIYLLAALTAITVVQRIAYVRTAAQREIGGIGMADTASQNGHRASTGKVRVAIVGVGNCASSFVQGVQYYKDAKAGRHPSPA